MEFPILSYSEPRCGERLYGIFAAYGEKGSVVGHFHHGKRVVSEFGEYFFGLFRHAARKGEFGLGRTYEPGVVRMDDRSYFGIVGVRGRMDSRVDGGFAVAGVFDFPFRQVGEHSDEIGLRKFRLVYPAWGYGQSAFATERYVPETVGEEAHVLGEFQYVSFRFVQCGGFDFRIFG